RRGGRRRGRDRRDRLRGRHAQLEGLYRARAVRVLDRDLDHVGPRLVGARLPRDLAEHRIDRHPVRTLAELDTEIAIALAIARLHRVPEGLAGRDARRLRHDLGRGVSDLQHPAPGRVALGLAIAGDDLHADLVAGLEPFGRKARLVGRLD